MSSESFEQDNTQTFVWKNDLNPEHYVYATYYFESNLKPKLAAIAMAKEQSALTINTNIPNYDIETCAARVVSVDNLGKTKQQLLPPYSLNTSGYPNNNNRKDNGYWKASTCIAYPLINFNYTVTSLWNTVLGELPRLGYLNAIRLIDLKFSDLFLSHFSGPRYGISGIRNMLGIKKRPILCRSARPAVGLTVDMMLEIGEKVLKGGFDILKDDELTYSSDISSFQNKVSKIVELTKRIEKETSERKFYFANVIEDFSKSLELIKIAETAGVNGILVAPAIQGYSIISEIVKNSELVILAHNSCEDIWTRLPNFGVSPAVIFKVQRLSGADMLMLPGAFSTDNADKIEMQACITACTEPMGTIKPSLPIMAGGKQAQELINYINYLGNTDFMMIVASAIDEHPNGFEQGARAFREAWNTIEKENQGF
jgi:ribulose-bisphosphate carboxylase large chain